MNVRRRVPAAVLVALALAGAPLVSAAPPLVPLDLDRGSTALGLALRRVGVTARVLYVTAHPDDEHNGVLVRLSRGLGLRTGLLTVTRGEGGQNLIGPELFFALGVLRTQELMAMHRYDGAEQYFGRAYEFGYSFSVEETFAKWGHDETLGDVVRVVRAFRPDVILTLPLESKEGGQHHQAAARLAREAFRAAADPTRFPEQLGEGGLRPWPARKIYQGGVGGFGEVPGTPVHVPTGIYDPLLGMTWQQLGSRARAMHRCQGANQLVAEPGPAEGVYSLVDAEPPVAAVEADILDGLDPSLRGLARFAPASETLARALGRLQKGADAARAAFQATAPEAAEPALAEALREVRAVIADLPGLVPEASARAEVEDRLRDEERDVENALVLSQGLVVEALGDDGLVTPGESFGAMVSVFNGSARPVELEEVGLETPAGWSVSGHDVPGPVEKATRVVERFDLRVATDARPSQPYWRRSGARDRYELLVPEDDGRPWSPPAVVARVRARIADAEVSIQRPLAFRYEGPVVGGEKRHEVDVVPTLSLRVSPERAVVPLAGARRPLDVRVFVRSLERGEGDARVRLEAPAGWTVEPTSAPLHFSYEGEEAGAAFHVTPPPTLAAGDLPLGVVAERDSRVYTSTLQEVEYPHIERRQLLRPAEVGVLALDVRTRPGIEVGYVAGSGDATGDAVAQLGVGVTVLGPDDLAFSDLSRFTTILTGIRAYETRPDLRSAHGRLMRWVEAGGHLVVQYNRDAFNRAPGAGRRAPPPPTSPYVPYPAIVTSERITDETAPVRVLEPADPLLNTPNQIGSADWDGWVQERGIQFLDARDPRYVQLLASTDPFPLNPGEKKGLLVQARVGRGTWTYVGLALFRQIPAGVPGGWRLLANLVSQ